MTKAQQLVPVKDVDDGLVFDVTLFSRPFELTALDSDCECTKINASIKRHTSHIAIMYCIMGEQHNRQSMVHVVQSCKK